jgi:ferredoxin, 2Fe-2S
VPTVHVEPLGADIELLDGEALAVAAWRLGYRWPTTCWGQAQCMLCRVEVVGGEDATVPATPDELEACRVNLPSSARRPGVRLACQLRVTGEGVTVRKIGVGPPPSR